MTDRPARALALPLVLSLGWAAAGALGRAQGRLGVVLGFYALPAAVLVLATWGRRHLPRLRPRARGALVGLLAAAVLVAGTYLVYPPLARAVPAVARETARLYGVVGFGGGGALLLLVVVVAEELLWRGALMDALLERTGPGWAALLATGVYALVQLGSGSWLVFALAGVLGGVWTLLRLATGGLLAPLLSHLAWTFAVILVHPLR